MSKFLIMGVLIAVGLMVLSDGRGTSFSGHGGGGFSGYSGSSSNAIKGVKDAASGVMN